MRNEPSIPRLQVTRIRDRNDEILGYEVCLVTNAASWSLGMNDDWMTKREASDLVDRLRADLKIPEWWSLTPRHKPLQSR